MCVCVYFFLTENKVREEKEILKKESSPRKEIVLLLTRQLSMTRCTCYNDLAAPFLEYR